MYIKKLKFHNQVIVENFLKLFEEDYPVSVNKVMHETQGHRMRQKNIVLPSMDDIKTLNAKRRMHESFKKFTRSRILYTSLAYYLKQR